MLVVVCDRTPFKSGHRLLVSGSFGSLACVIEGEGGGLGWSGGSWYLSGLRSWQKTDQSCSKRFDCMQYVDFLGHSGCQGVSMLLIRGTP